MMYLNVVTDDLYWKIERELIIHIIQRLVYMCVLSWPCCPRPHAEAWLLPAFQKCHIIHAKKLTLNIINLVRIYIHFSVVLHIKKSYEMLYLVV